MAPTSTRILAVAIALAVIGCFNSDERAGANDTSSTGGGTDTVTMYSDESDDQSDDNWTAEETGPGETTCRDAIKCLVMCQSQLIFNPEPEPNLECFLECDMGLTTEEAYLLIKLAECIGNKCADEGACGPESTNQDCLICIAANGQDPQPPGCIDEAAACQ
ncbi:MAG TPA: hypothetical protein VK034_02510 [Enhygromyxa sp.]|nr:hypothetical protein [Enhygromyxa sp.]